MNYKFSFLLLAHPPSVLLSFLFLSPLSWKLSKIFSHFTLNRTYKNCAQWELTVKTFHRVNALMLHRQIYGYVNRLLPFFFGVVTDKSQFFGKEIDVSRTCLESFMKSTFSLQFSMGSSITFWIIVYNFGNFFLGTHRGRTTV